MLSDTALALLAASKPLEPFKGRSHCSIMQLPGTKGGRHARVGESQPLWPAGKMAVTIVSEGSGACTAPSSSVGGAASGLFECILHSSDHPTSSSSSPAAALVTASLLHTSVHRTESGTAVLESNRCCCCLLFSPCVVWLSLVGVRVFDCIYYMAVCPMPLLVRKPGLACTITNATTTSCATTTCYCHCYYCRYYCCYYCPCDHCYYCCCCCF